MRYYILCEIGTSYKEKQVVCKRIAIDK